MTNSRFTINKSFARIVALTTFMQPVVIRAASSDWLAVDLDTTQRVEDPSYGRLSAIHYFDDHVQETISVTQSVRHVLDSLRPKDTRQLADALISGKTVKASVWIDSMPRAQVIPELPKDKEIQKVVCHLDSGIAKIACNDGKNSKIDVASENELSSDVAYAKSVHDKIILQGKNELAISRDRAKANSHVEKRSDDIKLIPAHEGLVTVAGGIIEFSNPGESRRVVLDPSVNSESWSIFVRSAESLTWSQEQGTLTALKSGETEFFVVTPGRISIISVSIKGASNVKNLASVKPKPEKNNNGMQVSSSLASLDGLDYAVTHGPLAGNHGGLASSQAPDLVVANEVVQIGTGGIASSASFARAKSKVSFGAVTIKVVDDRSNPGVVNYPLSGVRVKIAGTEYSELTNARGEIEVRDVPIGSRLLVELSDNRGHIMPQVSEVFIAKDSSGKLVSPVITARRFASIDFAARAVGVVQDMQKSSLCGTVANGRTLLTGYTVSLDVSAVGPFYFNHLGYADVRMSNTGRDGQFCFFNIEPGPATLAIRAQQSDRVFATALGVVAGRHQEERFNVADVRYISGSMAAVAAANEQLGSDPTRANRHDLVESGEIYAIGSGEMMVPIEDGRLTTASPVLSFKGRVWTVSSSADYETTVQAVGADSDGAGQVLKLVPNGFINDMAYFAHGTHSPDLGSVVVEHGQLGGHGKSNVKVRLVDPFGRDVGDGWYFADTPVAKAIFFNVPPGIYSMLVETESGHWIAADTVLVYSESLSYVKTGSSVERRVVARTQASIE